jgi:hypothetical protein
MVAVYFINNTSDMCNLFTITTWPDNTHAVSSWSSFAGDTIKCIEKLAKIHWKPIEVQQLHVDIQERQMAMQEKYRIEKSCL